MQTIDNFLSGRLLIQKCVNCVTVVRRIFTTYSFCCSFSNSVWLKVLRAINVSRKPLNWRRVVSWFHRKATWKSLLARIRSTSFAASVYMIWRARNSLIFKQQPYGADEVYGPIRSFILFKYSSRFKCSLGMTLFNR